MSLVYISLTKDYSIQYIIGGAKYESLRTVNIIIIIIIIIIIRFIYSGRVKA